jgi:beta-glucosidase
MTSAFRWGVATSAYQIEGGRTSAKGESIWDRFAHTPGRIIDGTTGDVACDHFNRWIEDVDLIADLGVTAYRFSIAWTRILPKGRGAVSNEGIAFYSDLIDVLIERGIEPVPTLYHWDLPQALEDQGGWRNRKTVDAFVEYASTVVDAYGDRVGTWITQNEPWVAAFLGHLEGVHAPGLTEWKAALVAAHHILLSHGRATTAMRSLQPGLSVGIALDCRPSYPASDSEADVAAQRHFDGFRNRWFFDPVFGKGYPADMMRAYEERGRIEASPSWINPGDLDDIAAPIDFLGINYYTSIAISDGADETEDTGVPAGLHPPDGYSEMGWEVTPDALGSFLDRVHAEYAPLSISITENGASYSDGPSGDGSIDDARRSEYLRVHIEAVVAARERGVPVDGYFVWSLMDNYEWALGYTQRFGIVWVDHDSGMRVPKASYHWYRQRILAGI